jgi:low affinity Fe/Cu permease
MELAMLIGRQVAFVGLLAGPIILVVLLGRKRGWNQTYVFVIVLGWALLFLGLNAMMAGDASAGVLSLMSSR